MNKKIVLVTGATGLLGSTLVPVLKGYGYIVVTHARASNADYLVELTNKTDAFAMLNNVRPEIIINLVGLTSVENCEVFPNEAYLANAKVVENLARWIKEVNLNSHLVQISTDHVYDGMRLNSEDQVVLTNYYAFSKFTGELAAAQVPSTILRTNFIGRSITTKRVSLTDWIYESLTTGKKIQVLNDVFFSPLSMVTLAEMIHVVIKRKITGVFNLGAHNGMSKANLDFVFAECLGLPTSGMSLVDASEAKFLKAYRPKDMRMDCSRFENAFDVNLPNLDDEIERVAKEYCEIG
jgi:dTDP-4-dehydrorhamnose reductase